jgi:outer membrane immunogenic protein
MFRKFLLASVGAVALTGSAALAADLPMRAPPPVYTPPPYSWTGLYLGGQIGYAWDNDRANINRFIPPVGRFPGAFLSVPFSDNPQGVIGGAHIGYNLQINQWLLGFEGTVDGTSISKTVGTFGVTDSFHAPVQGSIRARAGVAFDRVLLYVTGGAAFTGIKNSYTATTLVGGVPLFLNEQISKTRAGWTVGAGLEYAVTNNWSVRAEYRYSDFGRTPDYPFAAFVPAGGAFSVQHHLTQNQVQVGFSYKFDTLAPAPVVAKY